MFITIIIRGVWWPKKHRFRVVAVDHFIFLVSLLFLIRLYFLKRYTSLLRRMYYYIVYPILLSTEKKTVKKNPNHGWEAFKLRVTFTILLNG